MMSIHVMHPHAGAWMHAHVTHKTEQGFRTFIDRGKTSKEKVLLIRRRSGKN